MVHLDTHNSQDAIVFITLFKISFNFILVMIFPPHEGYKVDYFVVIVMKESALGSLSKPERRTCSESPLPH